MSGGASLAGAQQVTSLANPKVKSARALHLLPPPHTRNRPP